jgi:hypothetical protein
MTRDPSRLATVEQIVNGHDPFETVDTPLGTMERWKAEAMIIGTTSGALHVLKSIRADAATEAARADADQARNALIKDLCSKVDALTARVDAVTSELEAVKAKERADAEAAAQAEEERRRQLEEDPLEDPPDIAEYQARNPPAKIGDDTASSKEPEPSLEVEDDQSTLPNELQKGVAPAPSTYPTLELPQPPVVAQPIAISLNQE